MSENLVYGFGINDCQYPVSKYSGNKIIWRCPYYRVWCSMLKRAFDTKYKEENNSYQNVTVCEEWRVFSNFRAWMEVQDWYGKELDKDLLVIGNKTYSPENCLFVDQTVNKFLTNSAAIRGEWPIGVCWNDSVKKFVAQCRNPFSKKQEYLGVFSCHQQAHLAWKHRKHELACQLADIQTDKRIASRLRTRYE